MEIGLTILTLPNLSHAVHVERESNLACDEKFRSLSFQLVRCLSVVGFWIKLYEVF